MESKKTMNNIRFISWNVKGANQATKINKIMSHLQDLRGDVVFLQETHLRSDEVLRIKRGRFSHLYHSKFNARARGAAILIRSNIPFEPEKVVADPAGRFVIVTGRLCSTQVILASVYAPNWDDEQFISKLFNSIPNIETYHIIVGGDFNFVQDAVLDRSSSRPYSINNSAKLLTSIARELGLSDPWRSKFPNRKSFSFFSHVHHSYSRIDFFLLDNRLISNINSCEYHSIVISDHAPTSLDIQFPNYSRILKPWRFNSHLLSNDPLVDFLRSNIQLFFEINDTPDVSKGTLWEAFKAYLRGHIISYTTHLRKMTKSRQEELSQKLLEADNSYSNNPDPLLYKKRLQLQTEFNLLSTNEAELQLLKSRQRFFESGDRAGKLLAQQARAASASRLIHSIRSTPGVIITDPKSINETFTKFYSDLYASDHPQTSTASTLNTIEFPRVDEELVENLANPISTAEVINAISSLQSGKSPGPDGYSVQFYKKFAPLVSTVLCDVYNEALSLGQLPPTLTNATITLLLKKDKDPLLCSSFRPISLLNVDYKILAKILALRLQGVLPQIISSDQTGFMLGRHSFHNTRRLFNILNMPSSSTPEVVVSLDAEKAFDRVEWDFLFEVMEKFGLGSGFISWVKLLYSTPVASVLTNNTVSPPFQLHRGTRQGCPLSPLLFAIAIEPLAIWLRSENGFEGISRQGSVHKLSLYADDLLLYVSNPSTSLPIVLDILKQFGQLSGYKLNFGKSELFAINNLVGDLPDDIVPFKRVDNGFKYLGILITRSLSDTFNKNVVPLLGRVEEDFHRWSTLPLSLAGRVNLIKMTVLPKFLYLFQHIPVLISKKFFAKLDKAISTFLWAGKPVRMQKKLLQLPKSTGGLALPNFVYYYWAANIHKLLYWTDKHTTDQPAWVHIEMSSSQVSLRSWLCSPLPVSATEASDNPVVKQSFKIWLQFRKHFGLQGSSIHAPVSHNHSFKPSIMDSAFQLWSERGVASINDLYDNGTFMSFSDLSSKFNLPSSHLFRFFQIRHFAQKNYPDFPNTPPQTLLDTLLRINPNQKGNISHIFNAMDVITSVFPQHTKHLWEQDLGLNFEEDQWDNILELVHNSSLCARHGLIQCKLIHRTYYTNHRLSKFYPNVADSCNRCNQSPADLIHMFWSCPKLTDFWSKIFDTLQIAYHFVADPHPLSALFGIPNNNILTAEARHSMAFCTLLARRLILLNWKHNLPPSYTRWVKEVLHNLKLERLRFSLKGSLRKFDKIWNPLLLIIDSLDITPEESDI